MFGTIEIAIITFLALLPISNPFGAIPLYLSLTKGHSKEWAKKQALKACLFMIGILMTFLWSGALIIEFFGISIPAIQIAGGLIILKIGFDMLNPAEHDDIIPEADAKLKKKGDIAFTPLAMPGMSGPGSISVVISMAATADNLTGYLGISVGILAVVAIAFLALKGAPFIAKALGDQGLDALTRIMGFLLICIAFQFVLDGLGGYMESDRFMEPILEKIKSITTN